ncbi:short chain dehydrogenase [Fastidiosibacter lacustris]|uniref:short chain dehydrogenase n=1 Tax=Fastidiosibacter lacustris TaxID=2056695 RepID=UPI000E355D86|nr:short chain dehydrogenase [Fastidiosibacter lacustris]
MKKVIIIGATGTIGNAVCKKLTSSGYQVITISRSSQISVDISDIESIRNMYKVIGAFDDLISTTGKVAFKPIQEMSYADFMLGLTNKLMGQVNLVQEGLKYIKKEGSFTLTTGILNHEPIALGSSAAMVNAAIEGYVKAASLELREKARINAVSPTVITEALDKYASFFAGFKSISADEAALAYLKSVAGIETGKVFHVGF